VLKNLKNSDLNYIRIDLTYRDTRSTMENVSLQIINLRTNKETALATEQIYLNKSPDFQRTYEAWDDKLRTRFIETLLLNRATNPIWTVRNEKENSEEILDGMHRITTALAFLKNEFAINKNYLMSLDKEKYANLKFSKLDCKDQDKIRNYNFIFNKLDSSYRDDPNKLKDMYEILNRSSKTLNDYEFNKVLLNSFYEMIEKHKPNYTKTTFFSKITDKRGGVNSELIEMLVLTYTLPKHSWASVNKLKDAWIEEHLNDIEAVNKFMSENGTEVQEKLVLMHKMIADFYERELFAKDPKIFKTSFLPYKFIVARCCHLIKNYALFNRYSETLTETFKKELFSDNITTKLGCSTRNAQFQRKLIEKIDEIITTEITKDGPVKRFFPKKMISEKLLEQKNICPECEKDIKEGDSYHGDHIIPWTACGNTVIENLQVLHKKCHEMKK
jgi:hypothetical protein